MNENQKARWGKLRRVGKFGYALLNALIFSLFVYIFSGLFLYLWDKFIEGKEVALSDTFYSWISFAVTFVLWFIFSIFTWNRAEKEYLKT